MLNRSELQKYKYSKARRQQCTVRDVPVVLYFTSVVVLNMHSLHVFIRLTLVASFHIYRRDLFHSASEFHTFKLFILRLGLLTQDITRFDHAVIFAMPSTSVKRTLLTEVERIKVDLRMKVLTEMWLSPGIIYHIEQLTV